MVLYIPCVKSEGNLPLGSHRVRAESRVGGSSDRACVGCMVQVQTALGAVLRDASAKELPCGVFGSFGWSGEAVDELESRLRVSTVFFVAGVPGVHGRHITP